MEKIPTLIIALLAGGIVSMAVSFGVGVASLLGEYWIDYSTTTTTTATVSGFPATIVAAIRANIGLFTTCYFVDTTTTVTTLFGSTTTSLSTNACVDSATTGYIEAGLQLLVYLFNSVEKLRNDTFGFAKKKNPRTSIIIKKETLSKVLLYVCGIHDHPLFVSFSLKFNSKLLSFFETNDRKIQYHGRPFFRFRFYFLFYMYLLLLQILINRCIESPVCQIYIQICINCISFFNLKTVNSTCNYVYP